MSTFISRSQLSLIGKNAIAGTPGIALTPSLVDVPGSDLNLVVGMFAVLAENVAARGAKGQRGAFAELARGAQLDRVIYDRSGGRVTRFGATQATVDLVLSRPTPGSATPGTFDATSIVQTADGIQFATETDAVFSDLATSVMVRARAVVAGSDGNVSSGAIRSFGTTPFDSTLVCTNPRAAAGGIEQEQDIPLLGRYLTFWPTLSRGTLGAIEFGALQVAGVAVATAIEIMNAGTGYPAARVQLVISDQDGNASTDMVTAVADSLLEYRAAGIPVDVLTGTVFFQSVRWAPAFQTGVDEALATQRLIATTVAVAQFLPPGPGRGTLLRSKLIGAAQQVPGIIIGDASLAYPVGDVVPTSVDQMIRVRATDVSVR